MPTFKNTDSYTRIWPWLRGADGNTLELGPGEQGDVDVVSLDEAAQAAITADQYLKPVGSSSKDAAKSASASSVPPATPAVKE